MFDRSGATAPACTSGIHPWAWALQFTNTALCPQQRFLLVPTAWVPNFSIVGDTGHLKMHSVVDVICIEFKGEPAIERLIIANSVDDSAVVGFLETLQHSPRASKVLKL